MTKNELLAIYNSPAYRSAKYNYVWKNDEKAITSFWSDYESHVAREEQAALEKKAIKEEQDAANKKQLLEDYQTASTKVANAEILWDAAVRESGSSSADAKTAKNNLDEAIWFKNNIAQQLGYNKRPMSNEQSTEPITQEPIEEGSSQIEVANKTADLSNTFNGLINPTKDELKALLQQVGELEKEKNITQDTKNSLADLKKKINEKIAAIDKTQAAAKAKALAKKKTDKQIQEALKDWRTNNKSLDFLQKQGYVVILTTGKRELQGPDGSKVK